MEDRWTEVLNSAVTSHNARMRGLVQRQSWLRQNLRSLQNDLEKIEADLKTEIEHFDEKFNQMISCMNDPLVYVRNYNEANLEVYHGSLACGWINTGRVKETLLSEARSAGLRPCASCGHLAAAA